MGEHLSIKEASTLEIVNWDVAFIVDEVGPNERGHNLNENPYPTLSFIVEELGIQIEKHTYKYHFKWEKGHLIVEHLRWGEKRFSRVLEESWEECPH